LPSVLGLACATRIAARHNRKILQNVVRDIGWSASAQFGPAPHVAVRMAHRALPLTIKLDTTQHQL
jgi:hypothetical protein